MVRGSAAGYRVQPRVLVATSRKAVAEDLCGFLRREGFLCGVVASAPGPAARVRYPCDLLVLDLERGLGPDFVQAVKEAHPDLMVTALLGWWDAREAEVRECADYVLNVPVRGSQVAEMARGLLEGRRVPERLAASG